MAKLMSVHHLALTVTDVDRSVPWYVRVLDLEEVTRREEPDTGLRKVVLRSAGDEFSVVLVQHENTGRRGFDERRTGLDHVGFMVPTRDDLERWQEHLQRHGVVRADRARMARSLVGLTLAASVVAPVVMSVCASPPARLKNTR